jgi:16S rRNA (guanine(1405)-N(7))-methyltransferase
MMKRNLKFSNDAIERIKSKLSSKISDEKKLNKELKKELYEIHSNYYKNFNYALALNELKKSQGKETHEKLLKKYDSSRFIVLKDLYEKIFRITGEPRVLIDLACGLNPLTLPWMNLAKNCEYYCYDLEQNLIDFLNDYFKIMKKSHEAFLCDALASPSALKSDVALIFKSSTCFEWQSPKSTAKLLEKISADYIVISVMLRGEKNIIGTRNYLNSIIGDFIKGKETHEIILKKEYFLIIKSDKCLSHNHG